MKRLVLCLLCLVGARASISSAFQYKFLAKDPLQEKLENYLKSPQTHIIVVVGSAGTGKTLFSCQEAIRQLKEKKKDKIVMTRPLVHVEDEEIGFLPGDLNEKMAPWILPIMDHMKEYYEMSEIKRLLNENKLEISPLGYMRGRTFKNSFIILDEAQNTTPAQMKMFLTRIGSESKVVINGDLEQSDISTINGLQDFLSRIKNEYDTEPQKLYQDGFALVRLSKDNIYRHPLIKKVLDIYEN